MANTLKNFFLKIRDLAEENSQQTLILSSMLFTLVIWIFSFLSLLIGFIFFVFYLWSYIPRSDGSLSAYCSRKISKRLMQIVSVKVNAALAEEERRRKKAEFKAAKKAGERPPTEHKATIPNVGFDKLPSMPKLERTDTMATMTTLPPYTSQPGTPGGFELNALDQKRPLPSRSGTMPSVAPSSNGNFSARAPLLGFAAEPGMGNIRSASPAPTIPNLSEMRDSGPGNGYPRPPMRTGTGLSNYAYGGGPGAPPMQLNRTKTAGSMAPGPNGSFPNIPGGAYTSGPAMYSEGMPSLPQRVQSPASYANRPQQYGNQPNMQNMPNHRSNGSNSSNRFGAYQEETGRSSPAPSMRAYGPAGANPPNGPPGPYGGFTAPTGYSNDNFAAPPRGFPAPMRSATNPVQQRVPQNGPVYGQQRFAPQRNMTAPVPSYAHQHQDSNESYASYFELPAPIPAQQPTQNRPAYGNNGWNKNFESQQGPGRY